MGRKGSRRDDEGVDLLIEAKRIVLAWSLVGRIWAPGFEREILQPMDGSELERKPWNSFSPCASMSYCCCRYMRRARAWALRRGPFYVAKAVWLDRLPCGAVPAPGLEPGRLAGFEPTAI